MLNPALTNDLFHFTGIGFDRKPGALSVVSQAETFESRPGFANYVLADFDGNSSADMAFLVHPVSCSSQPT